MCLARMKEREVKPMFGSSFYVPIKAGGERIRGPGKMAAGAKYMDRVYVYV